MGRTEITTDYTSRTLPTTNVVDPIDSWFWDDNEFWNEVYNFWVDTWEEIWTQYSARTPVTTTYS